jgi:hypothetical protein
MSQSFVGGTQGYVQTGTLTSSRYAFKSWQLKMACALPKANNFLSPYQRVVAGLISAQLTVEGPYDGNSMAFSAGASYDWVLGLSMSISLTVTALISDITPKNDIEDMPRVSITAESDGAFTASIV